jgi:uncharacterized membrane protein YebE (DUF533 family)
VVADGSGADAALTALLSRDDVAFVHSRNVLYGCFMFEVRRGMSLDNLRILRLWAAAAWADGILHPSEAAALQRWIDASDDFTPDVRKQAAALLAAKPDVDPAEVRQLAPAAREGVYRAALGIVGLDGQVVDSERSFLARLKEVLDLPAATIEKIEREKR